MYTRFSRSAGEENLLRGALADLARQTGFPIVFGGFAERDRVVITQLVGNKGKTLLNLNVQAGTGLGGRALMERRPRLTVDYGKSRVITHDYDQAVLAEGITMLLAVPVAVDGAVEAVLYGGLRSKAAIGSVSIDPSIGVATALSKGLSQLGEPTLAAGEWPVRTVSAGALSSSQIEELRRLYTEVRGLGIKFTDPELHTELAAIERRIAEIASGRDVFGQPVGVGGARLTAREVDVLSLVALGHANASVGRTLGIAEATVKSYMNSSMRKLGVSTRFEAVAAARRRVLLP